MRHRTSRLFSTTSAERSQTKSADAASRALKNTIFLVSALMVVVMPSRPADAQAFSKGKSITMLITSNSGGPTDAYGRLVARFLGKYLPGSPSVIVQNMPGASGITATNYFVHQTRPDGLYVITGSNSILDPMVYRNTNSLFDIKKIRMVGGIALGGSVTFAAADAVKRLHDKSLPPVIVGNPGPLPQAGMQPILWSIEYLGWNAKWVVGYRGTNAIMLAFDRGEVELASTSNMLLLQERIKENHPKILFQGGSIVDGRVVGRPQFPDVPIFLDEMKGKITDPTAQKAFDYWEALTSVDKWVALVPETPPDILKTYREAFRKTSTDSEFVKLGDKISPSFHTIKPSEVEGFAKVLADTPPEALAYITTLMQKQGFRVK